MYPVRVVLRGDPDAVVDFAIADALRSSLELGSAFGTGIVHHVRTRVLPGHVEAIAFVAAPSLNAAEALCDKASAVATAPGEPFSGWRVTSCHADFVLSAGWLSATWPDPNEE